MKPDTSNLVELRLQLLGGLRVAVGGQLVTTLSSPRLQSLLAYLAFHRATPQHRQHTAFLFWPDTNEAQARTNLRKLLHHLHQALPAIDDYLLMEGQNLGWRPEAPVSVDVMDFENALAAAGATKDDAARRAALEQAVLLYQGDLLPGCYDDWVRPERDRLRQRVTHALHTLVTLLEAQRDYHPAISQAQRLLQLDATDEAAARILMRLLALDGDRAGALHIYHACATALGEELGVPPTAQTHAVYDRLLQAENSQPTGAAPAARPNLVGRSAEFRALQASWETASAGRPQLLSIEGVAGIGKTRLAEELLQWVRRQGYRTAAARCYAAEGALAYAPIVTWLRAESVFQHLARLDEPWLSELGRLLPEALTLHGNVPAPAVLRERWQRQQFFEALAHALLAGNAPLLLVIDDLQWADHETLEWLHFLLRFDTRACLLVVATIRTEEVTETHPLTELLLTLRTETLATAIELGPLAADATAALAAAVAGRQLSPAAAAHLYREAEGNPLFVVETVRAGWHEQQTMPSADLAPELEAEGRGKLPPTMQAVIARRLAQLSPAARELASLAATIGREFAADVLAHACHQDEDTLVPGLDELWQRRIVREHGDDAYDFTHDKLREVAYQSLSTARRRQAHRHVAQALQAVYPLRQGALASRIAYHFDRAGQTTEAVAAYRQAAAAAQAIFANDEAIRCCRRALALLAAAGEARTPAVQALQEQLGDILYLVARYDEADAVLRQAQASARDADLLTQIRLQRKIANTQRDRYRYDEALQTLVAALAVLNWDASGARLDAPVQEQPPAVPPDWFAEWLQLHMEMLSIYYWCGRVAEGIALSDHMQPVVARAGTVEQQANLMGQRAALELRQSRFVTSDQTLALIRNVLAARLEAGPHAAIPAAHFQLGFFLLWHGDDDEAETELLTSLPRAEETGDLNLQARCLTYLTIFYRRRGLVAETRRTAARALAVAGRVGMHEYEGLAKANLAWLAWIDGDWPAVEQLGQEALACWALAPAVVASMAFAWTAHWPLLAAAVAQQAYGRALDHVTALLDPRLQRMPERLIAALEGARQTGAQADNAGLRTELADALALAQQAHLL